MMNRKKKTMMGGTSRKSESPPEEVNNIPFDKEVIRHGSSKRKYCGHHQ